MSDAKAVALLALRSRAQQLADAILKAERAQAHFAIAVNAADQAGATQADLDLQVKLAAGDDEDRWQALERLRIVSAVTGGQDVDA